MTTKGIVHGDPPANCKLQGEPPLLTGFVTARRSGRAAGRDLQGAAGKEKIGRGALVTVSTTGIVTVTRALLELTLPLPVRNVGTVEGVLRFQKRPGPFLGNGEGVKSRPAPLSAFSDLQDGAFDIDNGRDRWRAGQVVRQRGLGPGANQRSPV